MSCSDDIFVQSQLAVMKRDIDRLTRDNERLTRENAAFKATMAKLPAALIAHTRGAQLAAAEAEVAGLKGVIKDLTDQRRGLLDLLHPAVTDSPVSSTGPGLDDAFEVDPSVYVDTLKTYEGNLVAARKLLGDNMVAIDFKGVVDRALNALHHKDCVGKAGLRFKLKALLDERKAFHAKLGEWQAEIERSRQTVLSVPSTCIAYQRAVQDLVTATVAQKLCIIEIVSFSKDVKSIFQDVLKTLAADKSIDTELLADVEEVSLEFDILRLQYHN